MTKKRRQAGQNSINAPGQPSCPERPRGAKRRGSEYSKVPHRIGSREGLRRAKLDTLKRPKAVEILVKGQRGS